MTLTLTITLTHGADSAPITGEELLLMGFRRDESRPITKYILEAVEETDGCHASLHLFHGFDDDDTWIAEIWNWQTLADGTRICDGDQAVAIPRRLRTLGDVRRLCSVISDRWVEVRG